jgi:hypothetical protein
MSPWVRRNIVQLWHDGRNLPGADWDRNIDEHLDSADIVVLLVTPDFLDSDFCCEKEMRRALERMEQKKAQVVPVIVRPCSWKETPLAAIEVIPDKALPVTLWQDRDLAWKNVAESLAGTAREVYRRKLQILQKTLQESDAFSSTLSQYAAAKSEQMRIAGTLESQISAIDKELGPANRAQHKMTENNQKISSFEDLLKG